MINICIFCGGQEFYSLDLLTQSQRLGKLIAENNCCLIYGGGKTGMMGALSKSAIDHGAKVVSILPERIVDKTDIETNVHELIITKTLAERKQIMFDRSDIFLTLPGAIGTMDEFFEVWVHLKLEYHNKPIGILNSHNYYDGLIQMLDSFSLISPVSKSSMEIMIEKCPEKLFHSAIKQHKSIKKGS